jgi:hypothetical protein
VAFDILPDYVLQKEITMAVVIRKQPQLYFQFVINLIFFGLGYNLLFEIVQVLNSSQLNERK